MLREREIAEGITVDPQIVVGKPAVAGTRLPVEPILATLAANPGLDDLLLDYPALTLEQVRACWRFAPRLGANTNRR